MSAGRVVHVERAQVVELAYQLASAPAARDGTPHARALFKQIGDFALEGRAWEAAYLALQFAGVMHPRYEATLSISRETVQIVERSGELLNAMVPDAQRGRKVRNGNPNGRRAAATREELIAEVEQYCRENGCQLKVARRAVALRYSLSYNWVKKRTSGARRT